MKFFAVGNTQPKNFESNYIEKTFSFSKDN